MRSSLALIRAVCFALVAAQSADVGLAVEKSSRGSKSHLPVVRTRANARPATSPARSVRTTENFRITAARAELAKLASLCEELRTEYQQKWLGSSAASRWSPLCEVVLHTSPESYLSQVGRAGVNSSGCSTIRIDNGKIVFRRIDIRVNDRDYMLTALPHELMHVVLADAFKDRNLPRWADEGIAVLVDPAEKRAGRSWDLQHAITHRKTFRLAELMQLDEYPAEGRLGTFYGQSGSVVEFLVEKGTPEQFVRFVQSAGTIGYDAALRTTYGVDGIADLEQKWLKRHTGGSPGPSAPTADIADGGNLYQDRASYSEEVSTP